VKDVILATRFPAAVVRRIDEHMKRLAEASPVGVRLTRSDVVRNLVATALERAEEKPPC
jgi:hypothetical protein